MGSLSLYQLIVSAKALLQAGHKKPLSLGLLSRLSFPSPRPCCACIATLAARWRARQAAEISVHLLLHEAHACFCHEPV